MPSERGREAKIVDFGILSPSVGNGGCGFSMLLRGDLWLFEGVWKGLDVFFVHIRLPKWLLTAIFW